MKYSSFTLLVIILFTTSCNSKKSNPNSPPIGQVCFSDAEVVSNEPDYLIIEASIQAGYKITEFTTGPLGNRVKIKVELSTSSAEADCSEQDVDSSIPSICSKKLKIRNQLLRSTIPIDIHHAYDHDHDVEPDDCHVDLHRVTHKIVDPRG